MTTSTSRVGPVGAAGALRTLQDAVRAGYRLPRRLRVDPRPGAYYVSVVNGRQVGLLLGPFRRHRQALRFVRVAHQEAERHDAWAWAYAYGTVRVENESRPGRLNAALGFGVSLAGVTARQGITSPPGAVVPRAVQEQMW